MSKTAEIVITEGIAHEELTTVEDNGVELDGFHESRDIATAESSATGKRET